MTLHISLFTVIAALCILLLICYISFYIFFLSAVKREERALLDIFLRKISKVPALIEVMRPYIVKPEAFDAITRVHTMTIIESTDSLYDILAHNSSLQSEFLFLMKLSQHAGGLQKHEYFLYIRDFIIGYERDMKSRFLSMNQVIQTWNRFVRIKNMTLIGYLLPGSQRSAIM